MVRLCRSFKFLKSSRLFSTQLELLSPKSKYQNGKFISPWGCESRGNSWLEMLKSVSVDTESELQDLQKVDNFIKSCILKSVKSDVDKIKSTSREHCTWIGHSTCLIQTNGVFILTDPVWSDIVSPVPYIGPRRTHAVPVRVEDIPCDVVMLSHTHYDHLDLETARRIGNRALWIVPLKVKEVLKHVGVTNCVEMDWWESRKLTFSKGCAEMSHSSTYLCDKSDNSTEKNIIVTCLPAKHWSARTLFDKNTTLWASFAVSSSMGNYYFAGDTGYCSRLFADIGKLFGHFDLALLPIGAYKPRKRHEEVHCDPAEVVQMHKDLRTRLSLGIHWGVFNLAEDSGCEAAFELHRCRLLAGLTEQDIFTMAPGECVYTDLQGEEKVNDISRMYPHHAQRYLDLNSVLMRGTIQTV